MNQERIIAARLIRIFERAGERAKDPIFARAYGAVAAFIATVIPEGEPDRLA